MVWMDERIAKLERILIRAAALAILAITLWKVIAAELGCH
jgi:hypothetical protein